MKRKIELLCVVWLCLVAFDETFLRVLSVEKIGECPDASQLPQVSPEETAQFIEEMISSFFSEKGIEDVWGIPTLLLPNQSYDISLKENKSTDTNDNFEAEAEFLSETGESRLYRRAQCRAWRGFLTLWKVQSQIFNQFAPTVLSSCVDANRTIVNLESGIF